jgi:plastocyanin
MRRRFAALAIGGVLVLTGCSSAGRLESTRVPATAAACARTAAAGTVAVTVKDFEFEPAAVAARVGQVVAFTNAGFEHHTATLDAGGCGTGTLETGARDGLVFTTAGRYAFRCTVHPWMTGTITIAG